MCESLLVTMQCIYLRNSYICIDQLFFYFLAFVEKYPAILNYSLSIYEKGASSLIKVFISCLPYFLNYFWGTKRSQLCGLMAVCTLHIIVHSKYVVLYSTYPMYFMAYWLMNQQCIQRRKSMRVVWCLLGVSDQISENPSSKVGHIYGSLCRASQHSRKGHP